MAVEGAVSGRETVVGGRRQWEVPLVGGRRQWETEWEGSRAGGTGAVGEVRIRAGEGDGSGREMVVGWFEVNSSRNDEWEAPGVGGIGNGRDRRSGSETAVGGR